MRRPAGARHRPRRGLGGSRRRRRNRRSRFTGRPDPPATLRRATCLILLLRVRSRTRASPPVIPLIPQTPRRPGASPPGWRIRRCRDAARAAATADASRGGWAGRRGNGRAKIRAAPDLGVPRQPPFRPPQAGVQLGGDGAAVRRVRSGGVELGGRGRGQGHRQLEPETAGLGRQKGAIEPLAGEQRQVAEGEGRPRRRVEEKVEGGEQVGVLEALPRARVGPSSGSAGGGAHQGGGEAGRRAAPEPEVQLDQLAGRRFERGRVAFLAQVARKRGVRSAGSGSRRRRSDCDGVVEPRFRQQQVEVGGRPFFGGRVDPAARSQPLIGANGMPAAPKAATSSPAAAASQSRVAAEARSSPRQATVAGPARPARAATRARAGASFSRRAISAARGCSTKAASGSPPASAAAARRCSARRRTAGAAGKRIFMGGSSLRSGPGSAGVPPALFRRPGPDRNWTDWSDPTDWSNSNPAPASEERAGRPRSQEGARRDLPCYA